VIRGPGEWQWRRERREREPHCRSFGCDEVVRCARLAAYADETPHHRLPYRSAGSERRMGQPTHSPMAPPLPAAGRRPGPHLPRNEIRAPETIRGPDGWQWRRERREGVPLPFARLS